MTKIITEVSFCCGASVLMRVGQMEPRCASCGMICEVTVGTKEKNKKPVDREALLKAVILNTFWMARRYAHGRHTFAPTIVRESWEILQNHFPEIKIAADGTIEPPKPEEINGMSFRDDYLDDISF